jgi:hypothetical protein
MNGIDEVLTGSKVVAGSRNLCVCSAMGMQDMLAHVEGTFIANDDVETVVLMKHTFELIKGIVLFKAWIIDPIPVNQSTSQLHGINSHAADIAPYVVIPVVS